MKTMWARKTIIPVKMKKYKVRLKTTMYSSEEDNIQSKVEDFYHSEDVDIHGKYDDHFPSKMKAENI